MPVVSRRQKLLRFYNPFSGTPVPFKLSGLFLFDPETMVKLHGSSIRSILFDEFGEAFYKKLERVTKGKQPASPHVVAEFLDRIPADVPLAHEMRAALNGDADAQSLLDSTGIWETHFLAAGHNLQRMSGRGALLLAIERASSEPMRLIRSGEVLDAVARLRADPLLSMFLWSEVVDAMEQYETAAQLLPAQAAIATEILLCYLAAGDAELSIEGESAFACLLPGAHATGRNPTSLFFDYLRKTIGVKSMMALLAHPNAASLELDLTTLKRWSAGTHVPEPEVLMRILEAFFGDTTYAPVRYRYWGARYLNFIGYVAQTTATKARKLQDVPEVARALRPWPKYPYGHPDCESWMQARYPYWFGFHLKKRKLLPDGTREKRPMGLFS
jgi:hypothetical protein